MRYLSTVHCVNFRKTIDIPAHYVLQSKLGEGSPDQNENGEQAMESKAVRDFCAVEIIKELDPITKKFPCSNGAFEMISSLVSVDTFNSFIENAPQKGFYETNRDADSRHVYVTLESRRERLYLLYSIPTEELRCIWERRTERADFSDGASGDVKVMQIGIGNYGNHTDDPMVGMGYLIRTANGHAVIVDGGFDTEGCADSIYRGLEQLDIAKVDGLFAVDAWYITHLDGDHVGILKSFFTKYKDLVSVKSFVQNFPIGDPALIHGNYIQVGKDYISLMRSAYPEACVITAHPSDVFSYSGAKIKMLATAELHYGTFSKILDGNDASLVFMLEANGRKMLFMGDAGEVSSRSMYYAYDGDTLKCDVLQVPHHGLTTGCSVFLRTICEHVHLSRIYGMTDPDLIMLPMGETFNRYSVSTYGNNQRKWVFANYPQDGYFLDSAENDFGYVGGNIIVKNKENGKKLVSYMMSTDEEPMITVFVFSENGISVEVNEPLKSYFN